MGVDNDSSYENDNVRLRPLRRKRDRNDEEVDQGNAERQNDKRGREDTERRHEKQRDRGNNEEDEEDLGETATAKRSRIGEYFLTWYPLVVKTLV